jgi:hypothetical protein
VTYKHAPSGVITAMCLESDHQDAKGYSSEHPVSAWLLIMQKELNEAMDAWVTGRGDSAALSEILQVMTVGMRCLQQHGIVTRRIEETTDAATDLDAGRALDERVARLMWPDPDAGSTPIWIRRTGYWGPEFSTDVAAAMTVLDALAERGWEWSINFTRSFGEAYGASVWKVGGPGHHRKALTLPLAVCRAVVAALGEEDARHG